MNNERTLTAPRLEVEASGVALLVLTVVWHPDAAMVGARAIVRVGCDLALSRFEPLFYGRGDNNGSPLAHPSLSRSPSYLHATPEGDLRIHPPTARMPIEVEGVPVESPLTLHASRIDEGVMLHLGGRVALCAHRVDTLPDAEADARLIGDGSAMARVRRAIAQVGPTRLPVLILGESGTGKELVARAVHAASPRAAQPLVSLNMAALSESLALAELFGSVRGAYTGAQTARRGAWAEADGGTLFMDEIGDTPDTVQPMLLRAIETGEIRPLGATRSEQTDVRLVAATDRDLEAGPFNQPLLRRLEAFVIRLPPLRRRREDLGLIVRHLLGGEPSRLQLFEALPLPLARALCLHLWPGNVRELGHIVNRILLACPHGPWPAVDELFPRHAARWESAKTSQGPVLQDPSPTVSERVRFRRPASVDDDALLNAMEANRWCLRQAALALGVSRPSLYNLVARHPAIRRAEDIPPAEIAAALARGPATLEALASLLRTPRDALRRRLKDQGIDAPPSEAEVKISAGDRA